MDITLTQLPEPTSSTDTSVTILYNIHPFNIYIESKIRWEGHVKRLQWVTIAVVQILLWKFHTSQHPSHCAMKSNW